MDNRALLPEEFVQILEATPDADHEAMGSLTVHTGIHPTMGEITVVSNKQDAVLIHGGV